MILVLIFCFPLAFIFIAGIFIQHHVRQKYNDTVYSNEKQSQSIIIEYEPQRETENVQNKRDFYLELEKLSKEGKLSLNIRSI